MSEPLSDVLAPCGLYCAVCYDNIVNRFCHGCGCDCGHCAGTAHVDMCDIAKCARERGYETCAECDEMPCMELITFTYHPFWIHHRGAIETLRRAKKVGLDRVKLELREAFADEERRLQWAYLEHLAGEHYAAFKAWREERKDT